MRSRAFEAGEPVAAEGTVLYEQHSRQTTVYLLIILLGVGFLMYEGGRLWGALLVAFGLAMLVLFKNRKMTTITDRCILAYPGNPLECPILLYLDEICSWELKTGPDGTVVCYFGMADGSFASVDVVHKVRFYKTLKRIMPEREIILKRREKS